jgi:hypothetical protein
MSIINRIIKARDKPKNTLPGSTYSFFFGSTSSGKTVNERMQKYMSVGLVSFIAFPEMLADDKSALEKIRRMAQDDFFDAIEIARITDSSIREQAAAVLAQSAVLTALARSVEQAAFAK